MCRCFAVSCAQQQGRLHEPFQQYLAVDGLARFLACLTVHGAAPGGGALGPGGGGGLPLLTLALRVFVGVVKRDADERGADFNGRPHLRLLIALLSELPGGSATGSVTAAAAADPLALRCAHADGGVVM
jgi:hypothetical protein